MTVSLGQVPWLIGGAGGCPLGLELEEVGDRGDGESGWWESPGLV